MAEFGPGWFDEDKESAKRAADEKIQSEAKKRAPPRGDLALITWAMKVATKAHCDEGQMRKDPDYPLPYIVHPFRVSALVGAFGGSPFAVACAILHDVVEDTETSVADWPTDVVDVVMSLTKKPNQTKLEALTQLREAPEEALLIKLADRYDNATAESNGEKYFSRPDVLQSTQELLDMVESRGLDSGMCHQLYMALKIRCAVTVLRVEKARQVAKRAAAEQ
jgi:(p)ppGpp synthase/HD superfamily hydrolase